MLDFFIFFLPKQKKAVLLQRKNGGTVAQLVEQRTENPRVTGSIPVGTTLKKPKEISAFFVVLFYYFCAKF